MNRATILFVMMAGVAGFVCSTDGRMATEPSLRWPDFRAMNQFYVDAFVRGENFGLSRMISSDLAQFKVIEVEGKHYNVEGVQLVGMLKAPLPRVYELLGNPTKQGIAHATARELDLFEDERLETLRSGGDMVWAEEGDALRALGAIRASDACLQCHDTRVGKLLGAFSYRLRPSRAGNGRALQ